MYQSRWGDFHEYFFTLRPTSISHILFTSFFFPSRHHHRHHHYQSPPPSVRRIAFSYLSHHLLILVLPQLKKTSRFQVINFSSRELFAFLPSPEKWIALVFTSDFTSNIFTLCYCCCRGVDVYGLLLYFRLLIRCRSILCTINLWSKQSTIQICRLIPSPIHNLAYSDCYSFHLLFSAASRVIHKCHWSQWLSRTFLFEQTKFDTRSAKCATNESQLMRGGRMRSGLSPWMCVCWCVRAVGTEEFVSYLSIISIPMLMCPRFYRTLPDVRTSLTFEFNETILIRVKLLAKVGNACLSDVVVCIYFQPSSP